MMDEQDLSSVHLIMVLNRGSTLSQWDEIGILDREMAIYRFLAEKLGRVSLVTWSKGEDLKYAAELFPIQIICNTKAMRARIWQIQFWWQARHWRNQNVVFKTNQLPGADWVASLARQAHAPLFVRCGYLWSLNSAREFGPQSAQARKARRVEQVAFSSADASIVTTDNIRNRILQSYELAPEKVWVLPNYVDIKLFYPFPHSRKTGDGPLSLLAVGRLSAEKNLDVLLRATALSKGWKLTIVGDGPLKKDLEALAGNLALDVHFIGIVPHSTLPSLMNSADVFALPSLYEGNPKSLLEAMACGVAVVGHDVDGIRDVIAHGKNGMLFSDGPMGLARVLDQLKDKNTRKRLGCEAARKIALENSLVSYANGIIEVLKTVA